MALDTLEPTSEKGGAKLSFVFRDRTAPAETYGAGRFLSADAPVDGKLVLDFNRAYNPPCAFTAFATCPLPPPENWLPAPKGPFYLILRSYSPGKAMIDALSDPKAFRLPPVREAQ